MKRLNVILGKKQLVAAGLTVLLGTAVAVNFIYSGGKDKKLTEPAAEVSGRPVRPMGKARMGLRVICHPSSNCRKETESSPM